MSAEKKAYTPRVELFFFFFYFSFSSAQGHKRCKDGCIIIQRFALHVYPFAFLLKIVVAETAARLHSFKFTEARQPPKIGQFVSKKATGLVHNSIFRRGNMLSD